MIPHSIHHILTIPTAYTEITITIHNLLTGYIEPIHFKNHYSRNFGKSRVTEEKKRSVELNRNDHRRPQTFNSYDWNHLIIATVPQTFYCYDRNHSIIATVAIEIIRSTLLFRKHSIVTIEIIRSLPPFRKHSIVAIEIIRSLPPFRKHSIVAIEIIRSSPPFRKHSNCLFGTNIRALKDNGS